MQIHVKTLRGKTLTFDVDKSETLRDLKIKVQERETLPPHQQRINFGGYQLFGDEESVLDQVNTFLRRNGREPIKGDHSDITLWLTPRFRGGGNQIYHRPVFSSLSDSESDDDDRKDGAFVMSRSDQINRTSSLSDQLPRNGSSESAAFNGASAYRPHQIEGLHDSIEPSLENGVYGDDADLHRKKNELTSNVFPEKQTSFWRFLSDARISINIVMVTIASALFLVPKAMRKVWDSGVEDGGSIVVFATLSVVATAFLLLAIRHCRRIPLRQEIPKLYLEVLRDGKRLMVSVSEIAAGDVVVSSEQPTRVDDDRKSTRTTITTMPSTVLRVFKCKTCNRQFSSLATLRGHMATHKKPQLNKPSIELQTNEFIKTE
ncbi:hypothetical protein Sjap_022958 [Stephania japonica]|uniref:Ubiquitin-like domain-containing protein n=1 Tax=Stephania japonica TaxID=461633 RepID=A0AAP0EPW0_9MAGN